MKSIKFRFPVYYNGAETQEVDLSDSGWDYQRSLESCVLLMRVSNRKSDSYVKLNVKMEDYYRIKDSTGTGKSGGVTEDE